MNNEDALDSMLVLLLHILHVQKQPVALVLHMRTHVRQSEPSLAERGQRCNERRYPFDILVRLSGPRIEPKVDKQRAPGDVCASVWCSIAAEFRKDAVNSAA